MNVLIIIGIVIGVLLVVSIAALALMGAMLWFAGEEEL